MKTQRKALIIPVMILVPLVAACWSVLGVIPQTTEAAAPAAEPMGNTRLSYYLLRDSREIHEWLVNKNYRTVGVIKFKVQAGDKTGGYNMGLLNTNAAAMLEDCLAMGDVKDRLRILANPSRTAHDKFPRTRLSRAADLRNLVTLEYPLRTGGKARPDVLLTGDIRLGVNKRGKLDSSKVSIALKYLDARNPMAFQTIPGITGDPLVLEMPSDRFVLGQSGSGYQLSRKGLAALKGNLKSSLDEQMVSDLQPGDPNPEPQDTPPQPRPDPMPVVPATGAGVLQFRVLYGGTPAEEWKTVGSQPGCLTLKEPPPVGTIVTLQIKNPSAQKVGAVVLVNGVNSIFEERDDGTLTPTGLSRWILDPGKTQEIKGFLQRDKEISRQFVAQDPQTIANLGDLASPDQLGMITIHEIQSQMGVPPDRVESSMGNLDVTRGIKSSNPKEALKKVSERLTARKKNVIVGGEIISTPVVDDVLPNPVVVANLNIRYSQVPVTPGN